jgi:hypothetical protein
MTTVFRRPWRLRRAPAFRPHPPRIVWPVARPGFIARLMNPLFPARPVLVLQRAAVPVNRPGRQLRDR